MVNRRAWRHDKSLSVVALALLVVVTYYHSLFQIARADQLIYFYRTAFSSYDGFWALTGGSYAFNRSDSIGDFILFRPVLYILLGWQRWAWSYNFFLWQATSLLLHLAVVLSLFFYLRSVNRNLSLLPFSFSIFFGVLLTGTEMVAWQHVSGYLLFCFLAVQALIRFKRIAEQYSLRDSIYLFFFTAVACFTFELGNVLALLISVALISISAGSVKHPTWRDWRGIFRQDDPRARLSFALAALPVIYIVASVSDYFLRFGGMPSIPGGSSWNIFTLFEGMMLTPLQWIATAFFPSMLNFLVGSRLEILSLKLSGWSAVATTTFGLAVLVNIVYLAKRTLSKKLKRTSKIVLVTVVGIAIGYVALIVMGREAERGVSRTLHGNSYYAYIFMMFAMIAIFHCIVPAGAGVVGYGKTRTYTVLAVLLLILSAVNAVQVWKIQYRMRYDYSAPRIDLVKKIIDLHKVHSDEEEFSFSVSPNCSANDQLPWFKAHGRGERGVYRLADALFPFSSRESSGKYLISCP